MLTDFLLILVTWTSVLIEVLTEIHKTSFTFILRDKMYNNGNNNNNNNNNNAGNVNSNSKFFFFRCGLNT
jgi:hypothetical protein